MPVRLAAALVALVCLLAGCSQPSTPVSESSEQPSSAKEQTAKAIAKGASEPIPSTPAPAPAAQTQPKPLPIVIPAGTVLTVRLSQAVGSKISQAGDRFDAAVAEPVEIAGKVAIPKGAEAWGTVTEAKAAGRFKGGATLAIALDAVLIDGRKHAIVTELVAQASKGKGKRTAAMVGGGAGAGALVGGLAGGGKGAAIGAAVGAGAGTATAGLTGDRDIALPAESAVSFILQDALTIESPNKD